MISTGAIFTAHGALDRVCIDPQAIHQIGREISSFAPTNRVRQISQSPVAGCYDRRTLGTDGRHSGLIVLRFIGRGERVMWFMAESSILVFFRRKLLADPAMALRQNALGFVAAAVLLIAAVRRACSMNAIDGSVTEGNDPTRSTLATDSGANRVLL
jgi:hypothetical protein